MYLPIQLMAQPNIESISSLESRLTHSSNDSERVIIKLKLAWELRHINVALTEKYTNECLAYGKSKNNYSIVSEAFRAKATSQIAKNDLSLSLQLYDSCKYYAIKSNNLYLLASCYSLMAGLFGDQGDYDQAITLYTKGLAIAMKTENNYIKAVLCNNLADAYQYTKRNTKLVQENFRLAIHYAKLDSDYWGACLSAGNLAREFANEKELDSMKKYMNEAKLIFNYVDTKPYHRASVCNELAAIHLILKEPAKAKPYAIMGIHVLDSLKRQKNVLQSMSLLMNCHYDLNEIKQTKEIAEKLLKNATKEGSKLYIQEAYKTLANLAEQQMNYKEALYNFKEYKKWGDSIFSYESDKRISAVELNTKIAQKELETKFKISQQAKENEILKSNNASLKWQIYTSLLFALISFIGGFLLYNANRKQKKAKQALEKEKLIVEKQAHEKTILINEIHHRVKNNLTMLKSLLYLQAKASKDPETKRILKESQSRIHSMALVHQNLFEEQDHAKLDFLSFIKNLLNELTHSYHNLSNEVEIMVDGDSIELDIELAIPLAIIMNELATNSFKYAFNSEKKGYIKVNINKEVDSLCIIYEDNGPGLKQEFRKDAGGFGFNVLHILIQQINATMLYENKKSSQFTIKINQS